MNGLFRAGLVAPFLAVLPVFALGADLSFSGFDYARLSVGIVIVFIGAAALIVFSVVKKRIVEKKKLEAENREKTISELEAKISGVKSKIDENVKLLEKLNKAIHIRRMDHRRLHSDYTIYWSMLVESARVKEQRALDKAESDLTILEKDKIELKKLIKDLAKEKDSLEAQLSGIKAVSS